MNSAGVATLPDGLSPSQGHALLSLLSDEDPAVYGPVREKIISCGPSAAAWLRPHTTSDVPALRRRAQEIVLHFDRRAADDQFLAFCLRHGEDLDMEEGALLLAQTRYPSINREAYTALLDAHAGELQERIDFGAEPKELLGVMNQYLFGHLGFAGNEQNYYDPENSYLNRVLDRRTGNPINLCLLYILLARRLHLPVAGIGLPGHFICRYQSTSAELYLDPFHRGKLLTKSDCVQYLTRGNFSLRDDYLTPVTPRRLLLRICANLHQIYQKLELAPEATRLQRYLVALGR
ncbi:MAG TPA: transglutaminase-like domain-containing protein [Candidatus Acidoferrum sp.]|nr:transglutaminase-like domain-containing protein [Candidatus Acidoferrum sp.]